MKQGKKIIKIKEIPVKKTNKPVGYENDEKNQQKRLPDNKDKYREVIKNPKNKQIKEDDEEQD